LAQELECYLSKMSENADDQELLKLSALLDAVTSGPNGFVSDSVFVSLNGPRGRGLFTRSQLNVTDLVLAIPLECTIAPNSGLSLLRQLGVRVGPFDIDNESLLAIFIALHSSQSLGTSVQLESRAHHAYMDALPSRQDAEQWCPLMWDLADTDIVSQRIADALRGAGFVSASPNVIASAIQVIATMQDDVRQEYGRVAEVMRDKVPPGLTLDSFLYGFSIVNSRNFYVSSSMWIDGGRCFMLPFADMVNHGLVASTANLGDGGHMANFEGLRWVFNEAAKTVEFRAARDIHKGCELLINYSAIHSGKVPTDNGFHFLCYYGFVESAPEPLVQSKL